ncbi:MAG: diacylglycerol kinase family protein [Thermodesulfobacteriota bacterium]
MKVRFIINPIAGGKNRVREISEAVSRVFSSDHGIYEVRVTGKKGDANALARDAVAKGYDALFACGGDGTLNEVASELVKTDVILGIVPAGSGNGLARALKIPWEPEAAVRLLKDGFIRRVDAGVVGGGKKGERYFFSTAGFGFDALLSKRYNERPASLRVRGVLPYVPIALVEFFKYRPENTLIMIDGKYRNFRPFILTVANTEQYGSSAIIAPGAVPDDGLFDICIVEDVSLFSAIRDLRKLFSGNIDTIGNFKRIKAGVLEVLRRKPGLVHADGEYFEGDKKVEIRNLPGALKILVKEGPEGMERAGGADSA